ncbi:hypothetical protein KM043_011075 [Ampulex compressa]|nr:hypothetical protein KM043_011075 [Ampulex compressa]
MFSRVTRLLNLQRNPIEPPPWLLTSSPFTRITLEDEGDGINDRSVGQVAHGFGSSTLRFQAQPITVHFCKIFARKALGRFLALMAQSSALACSSVSDDRKKSDGRTHRQKAAFRSGAMPWISFPQSCPPGIGQENPVDGQAEIVDIAVSSNPGLSKKCIFYNITRYGPMDFPSSSPSLKFVL